MKLIALLFLILLVPASRAFGWFECGHHIVAVMAFDLIDESQQRELIRVLRTHPNFATDFVSENGSEANDQFLIGTAGYWPDIARRYPEWNRPTWHYQLGSTMTIGRVHEVPQFPGDLPANATLETQELYIAQALELCRRIIADESSLDCDKAVAICWICHLVADSHQPCHAGSLYVETVFPEGDRGANSISTKQGGNMHALWDSLLGSRYDAGDVARRVEEIRSDVGLMREAELSNTIENSLSPLTWLQESREAARACVYTPEVLEPVSLAMRSGTAEFRTLDLNEQYLKQAGRVAQLRSLQAALRLSRWLQELAITPGEEKTHGT